MTLPVVDIGLLPCPFCGGDFALPGMRPPFGGTELLHHVVMCGGCGAKAETTMAADTAIAAWNRRALTASERLVKNALYHSAIKDCTCEMCLQWKEEARAILAKEPK